MGYIFWSFNDFGHIIVIKLKIMRKIMKIFLLVMILFNLFFGMFILNINVQAIVSDTDYVSLNLVGNLTQDEIMEVYKSINTQNIQDYKN